MHKATLGSHNVGFLNYIDVIPAVLELRRRPRIHVSMTHVSMKSFDFPKPKMLNTDDTMQNH